MLHITPVLDWVAPHAVALARVTCRLRVEAAFLEINLKISGCFLMLKTLSVCPDQCWGKKGTWEVWKLII